MYDKVYYVKKSPQRKPKNFKFFKYLILLAFFIFTVNVFANIFIYSSVSKGSLLVSPLAQDIIHKTVTFINSRSNSTKIENIAIKILGSQSKDYGIVVKNLKTGERYYLNENKIFSTASLYKLWIMAVTFDQINKGKFLNSDVMSDDIPNINERFNIASESAEITEGTVTHTVSNALTQMITVSDNYSAYLLTDMIGINSVSDFLVKSEFKASKVGSLNSSPKSSALDISIFFDKLYEKQIIDSSSSEKMINLLKDQKRNSKLPRQLPEEIVFAHKTGELGRFSHDGGIVYTKKGDYIIVVMSETNNTITADNNMALISKEVFDYFTK